MSFMIDSGGANGIGRADPRPAHPVRTMPIRSQVGDAGVGGIRLLVTHPEDRVMCLFVILLFFGPRAAIALWWLFEPLRWDVTFSSFWLPFLGFLLAPWTTLMYVLVAPGGVNGFDWLWLGLAVLADIASYSSGGVYGQRRRSVREA